MNDCWLWPGAVRPDGYAQRQVGARKVYVHRYAYEQAFGPIPAGLEVDHLCRVRHCINPAHLEAVTPRVNTMRGQTTAALNAAKTACVRGHLFDEANTYRRPNGTRHCRACACIASANYRDRRQSCDGPQS